MIIETLDLKPNTAPGERLKYIRSMLRVSRAYIQEKYNIPAVTLKSWENGTTKLTLSGVKRCVEVYRNEGLIVSEDWIIDGTGLDPKSTMAVSNYFALPTNQDISFEDDEIAMIRDANAFKESYANAVVMLVSNNDMLPIYQAGDYIGGKIRCKDDIFTCINKDCIVYLKNNERYFRRLVINHSGGYNLSCLNPHAITSEPVLFNVEIDNIAPVIWHRWKDT